MLDNSVVIVREGDEGDPFDLIALDSGQKMRVHSGRSCLDVNGCAVHNPSDHPLKRFPLHWRWDKRIFERICECGVGHPDPDSLRYEMLMNGFEAAATLSVHGDMCYCCRYAYDFLREEAMAKDNTTSPFITKDSGKRAVFEGGMVRDTNEGKARFDLLRPHGVPYKHQLLTRFAELMGRGAEKYDARNWELATGQTELDRFQESAERHFNQWMSGELDEDHAAAVMFNLLGAETVKYKMGLK